MPSGDISSTSSAQSGQLKHIEDNGREVFSVSFREEDDEEALKWAAIEKLPSYLRIARGILTKEEGPPREIEIKSLGFLEKTKLLERLLKVAEEDNEKFLIKLKERIDRPLKKHGVTDHEICMIANIPPESADDVFVLAPSLKGKKNKVTELLKVAFSNLAKLKQSA